MVSMNSVWDEAVAFIRREAGLLVWLTLATVMVGNTAVTLLRSAMPAGDTTASMLQLIAGIWSLIGQLAITALVLRPSMTVGESLALAFRRLGTFLLIGIIFAIVVVIVLVPLFMGLALGGFDVAKMTSTAIIPGWATVYIGALIGLAGWLGIRLSLLTPLVMDRNSPIFASLRDSFAMTHKLTLQLAVPLILFVVVNLILGLAVSYAFGSIALLLGSAMGSPFTGLVIASLANGLAASAMSLIFTVFLAVLYRRLNRGI